MSGQAFLPQVDSGVLEPGVSIAKLIYWDAGVEQGCLQKAIGLNFKAGNLHGQTTKLIRETKPAKTPTPGLPTRRERLLYLSRKE
ncbi:hypothetical protein FOQG_18206 [Fusarium oxysporum f. sp. raphani 54005]|uniref:Uncharacterized protein n=2 Tax=Fusarium oxysporum TaxID=5507 RepID=X0BF09_FUSOX|nr:hypothetical protein FOQG_18206 [Fusarium oxysporum f. sp. raphani 54005]EXL66703.1 hypothetical protein FOPG_17140 [Fusarium oxysporum f. sp. conglutinans race 2 54008]